MESDEYRLEIDTHSCNGNIHRKSDNEYMEYLSTHTFYGSNYQFSTARLQEYGFDVQLQNWDGKTEKVDYKEQWKYSGKCELCKQHDYCEKYSAVDCPAAKRWKEHLVRLEQIHNLGKGGVE